MRIRGDRSSVEPVLEPQRDGRPSRSDRVHDGPEGQGPSLGGLDRVLSGLAAGRIGSQAIPLLRQLQRLSGNGAVGHLLEGRAPGGGRPLESGASTAGRGGDASDLSDVRVHTGATAAEAADALDANAFTIGRDVFFGAGRYEPGAGPGAELLAHELTHVAQQRRGSTGSAPPSHAHEREAAGAGPGPRGATPAAAGVQRQARRGDDHGGGFFASIGRGLAAAGRGIWSGLQTAGRAIGTAAGAVWRGLRWVGGQLLDKIGGALGRVLQWVARLPERVGRLFAWLWQGVTSLHPLSLKWWESLGRAGTWGDFLKWLSTGFLNLVEVAGIPEIAETVADFVKFNTRALTGAEVGKARSVFGSSLPLHLVRLDERAVIGPSFTNRAYTAFHTINSWGALSDDVLMHELTHVWQYQQAGAIYMPQAIHAQMNEGYEYGGVAGLQAARAAGRGFLSFNREQQGQIVEDFYRIKHGLPLAPGAAADLPLYAHFVKTVSTLSEAELVGGTP